MSDERRATLYRMVLPEHACPYGMRAKSMLLEHGYENDDRVLRSREEVDAVKDEFGVQTTPIVFVGEKRIGDSRELEKFLEAS
jgi:glutaredoxin 3